MCRQRHRSATFLLDLNDAKQHPEIVIANTSSAMSLERQVRCRATVGLRLRRAKALIVWQSRPVPHMHCARCGGA